MWPAVYLHHKRVQYLTPHNIVYDILCGTPGFMAVIHQAQIIKSSTQRRRESLNQFTIFCLDLIINY